MTRSVRRLVGGVGLVGGAAVAAVMIGATGTPAARADDGSIPADIGLLNAAEANVADLFASSGQPDTIYPDVIGKLEAIQTPLLSSDNSLVSDLGGALFNGPDQQLAQSSEALLSTAEALTADPSATTGLAAFSALFQFVGSNLGDSLPANVIGKLVDQVLGYDIGSAGAAADLASSASSAAATPDEVMGQAISDMEQGTAVLDAAPTTDLGTRAADLLTGQEGLVGRLDPILTQLGSLQDGFNPTDQTLLGNVDELMVSSAQNIVSADQGFVAADQAGDLSGNSAAPADLAVLGADLNFLGSFLTADGASLFAVLTGGLDASSAADLASSLEPSAALDPSILADLLTSFGL
jgi:hypothetical protein